MPDATDELAPSLPEISPELNDAVDALYARLAAEIRATGVVCEASGRCCNFDEWDHTPFATTLELTRMLRDRVPDRGEFTRQLCPFWKEKRCTAREGRPLGCRVFYCTTSYQETHAQVLYERYHKELEDLCRQHGFTDYAYLPLVAGLKRWVLEGRFVDPQRPLSFPE